MSEYIKREDALNALREYPVTKLKTAIRRLPSADVAPVRHGRWIEKAFSIMCSDCGAEFKDEILYMIGNDEQMSYCLNCGTRMDGDDDEID